MKKMILLCMLAVLGVMLAACAKKTETAEETKSTAVPYETHATVVVDENANGPEAISIVDAYNNYPDDKKPSGTEPVIQIRYFYVSSDGAIREDFDVIEGKTECTAEDLIALMENDGVLGGESAVISYDSENGSEAVIELSSMDPVFSDVSEENLAQAVANTLIDNLFLDKVTIKVGDKTYGPLTYKK